MPPGFNPTPYPPVGSPSIAMKLIAAKKDGRPVTLLVSGQFLRHVTIVDYSTVEVNAGGGRTRLKYDSFDVTLPTANPYEVSAGTIAADEIAAVFAE